MSNGSSSYALTPTALSGVGNSGPAGSGYNSLLRMSNNQYGQSAQVGPGSMQGYNNTPPGLMAQYQALLGQPISNTPYTSTPYIPPTNTPYIPYNPSTNIPTGMQSYQNSGLMQNYQNIVGQGIPSYQSTPRFSL